MSTEAVDGTRPRVIVVDDDRETREMLRLGLELHGFDAVEAANGLRLVSLLSIRPPDAIVLDVVMEWIDGLELCRAIRQNPAFRHIPVVFVSARRAPDDIERGKQAGADDYFTKPFRIEALVVRLRELIDAQRDTDVPVKSASSPSPAPESPR